MPRSAVGFDRISDATTEESDAQAVIVAVVADADDEVDELVLGSPDEVHLAGIAVGTPTEASLQVETVERATVHEADRAEKRGREQARPLAGVGDEPVQIAVIVAVLEAEEVLLVDAVPAVDEQRATLARPADPGPARRDQDVLLPAQIPTGEHLGVGVDRLRLDLGCLGAPAEVDHLLERDHDPARDAVLDRPGEKLGRIDRREAGPRGLGAPPGERAARAPEEQFQVHPAVRTALRGQLVGPREVRWGAVRERDREPVRVGRHRRERGQGGRDSPTVDDDCDRSRRFAISPCPERSMRRTLPPKLARRIHRTDHVQVWFERLEPPFLFDSPFAGEEFAALVAWGDTLPRNWSHRSFANRLLSAGCRAVILVGAESARAARDFEWAHAARFPGLDVPAGQEATVVALDREHLPDAAARLANDPGPSKWTARRMLALMIGSDTRLETELAALLATVFAGGHPSGVVPTLAPEPEPVPAPAAEIATPVAPSIAVRAVHDHALFFQPGTWRFLGALIHADGSSDPADSELVVLHEPTTWRIDAPLGSSRIVIPLGAPRAGAHAFAWRGESPDFGRLDGHTSVVDDCVLTNFERAGRSAYVRGPSGSEVFRRLAGEVYEVYGAIIDDEKLTVSWHGQLRREG